MVTWTNRGTPHGEDWIGLYPTSSCGSIGSGCNTIAISEAFLNGRGGSFPAPPSPGNVTLSVYTTSFISLPGERFALYYWAGVNNADQRIGAVSPSFTIPTCMTTASPPPPPPPPCPANFTGEKSFPPNFRHSYLPGPVSIYHDLPLYQ